MARTRRSVAARIVAWSLLSLLGGIMIGVVSMTDVAPQVPDYGVALSSHWHHNE